MNGIPASRLLPDMQDILYCICSHLDPDRSSEKDIVLVRQALIRSALAWRNFTQPALNTLWRSLPSGKPLIALLCTLGIAQGRTFEVRAGSLPWEHPDPPVSTSYVCYGCSVHILSPPELIHITVRVYPPRMIRVRTPIGHGFATMPYVSVKSILSFLAVHSRRLGLSGLSFRSLYLMSQSSPFFNSSASQHWASTVYTPPRYISFPRRYER